MRKRAQQSSDAPSAPNAGPITEPESAALPAVAPEPVSAPTPEHVPSPDDIVSQSGTEAAPTPKRRGRPRKAQTAENAIVTDAPEKAAKKKSQQTYRKKGPVEALPEVGEPEKPARKHRAAKSAPASTEKRQADKQERIVVQFAGADYDVAAVREKVLAAYVAMGHRVGRIASLDIYVKPEEKKAYFVANGKINGVVDI